MYNREQNYLGIKFDKRHANLYAENCNTAELKDLTVTQSLHGSKDSSHIWWLRL